MKNITLIGKNVKTLNDMMKSIDEKLKPVEHEQQSTGETEKIENILEKKGIGRPPGNYETKQEKCCDMLNSEKVKTPKQQTLDDYKTTKMMIEYMYYFNNYSLSNSNSVNL